jgi:glycosyltransferase involved in cell wall biosynthesis
MASPRIVHVLGTGKEEGTGILRLVDALVAGADERGYESEYWFLGRGGVLLERLLTRGQRAMALDWSGSRYQIHHVLGFAGLLWKARPDLVCQHSGGRTIRRLAVMSGARVVLHVHGYVSESRGIYPSVFSGTDADAIIANSRATAEQIRATGRVYVIYPGAEASGARPYRPAGEAVGAFVLGAASRLAAVKGLDVLVEAVARVLGEFPGMRLEIAGSGPERRSLEAAARNAGIQDRVAFLGWCEDLAPLLATWDLFVQPSRAEGFGLAALDAMAAGVPVIASAVGGLVELIEDGRSGWLVPADDAKALAAKIADALRNPWRRHAVGEAGRRRVSSGFRTGNMVDATLAVYAGLLAGGAG